MKKATSELGPITHTNTHTLRTSKPMSYPLPTSERQQKNLNFSLSLNSQSHSLIRMSCSHPPPSFTLIQFSFLSFPSSFIHLLFSCLHSHFPFQHFSFSPFLSLSFFFSPPFLKDLLILSHPSYLPAEDPTHSHGKFLFHCKGNVSQANERRWMR